MSLTSMTGFAAYRAGHGEAAWVWELKSVNSKGLDVRLRLPPGFEAMEGELRDLSRQALKRGSLQSSLQMEKGPAAALEVNEAALEAAIRVAEKLRQRLSAPPVTVEGLLALPGILQNGVATADDDAQSALWAAVITSYSKAIAELARSRASEGAALAKLISGHLDRIESLTIAARDCPARAPDAVRKRLAEQIARLMEVDQGFDDQRLHQEALLLAARADVQEEIDRLLAHVNAARALVAEAGSSGRKLDFLAQEFNREANTLCSKSASRELTAIGLELKAVIDQFREQVQNIE